MYLRKAIAKGVHHFLKKNERTVVWAASCGCTFEVGERREVDALEGTTKNAHTQEITKKINFSFLYEHFLLPLQRIFEY